MKKGGMYDAIMKFMGGGNMEYMREGGKPDFLDLDKDGNKTESMKSAAASAKEMGKGGRMYRMGGVNEMGHGGVHKYPGGGVMPRKYENGGRGIEGRAEAPDTVSDLMKGLERYARRDERGLPQMSGKELEERLKELRLEQRKTSFEGDFRDPNLLFNQRFPDMYTGRTLGNDVDHPGRKKAKDFYQGLIDDLTTQAYLIANSDEFIPDYRKGEFGKILSSELASGKTLEQIREQMRRD